MAKQKNNTSIEVSAITHQDAKRKNIPTQEMQSIMTEKDKRPIPASYLKRNPDLDPQLIWRGKYDGDETLGVFALPLFTQEKVKPQVLIDDLKKYSKRDSDNIDEPDLFADFNGLPNDDAKTEFYQHDCNWQNRMILGDSLQVMTSLAIKEGLQGQVQCIYMDPPYGIKFNSNFQWSTKTKDVKDGKIEHITREPEQVKAFRDTWKDGVNSYLSYLRDRLIIARDLLSQTGSIFVQISDENIHLVRSLLDEVFGESNACSTIVWQKGTPNSKIIRNSFNYILWYTKDINQAASKCHKLFLERTGIEGSSEDPKKLALWGDFLSGETRTLTTEEKRNIIETSRKANIFRVDKVIERGDDPERRFDILLNGEKASLPRGFCWRGKEKQISSLLHANRIIKTRDGYGYRFYVSDFPAIELTNLWTDTAGKIPDMIYVVQTNAKIVERCILLASSPGDLVLDPTCGSGTTAYVAEQWGRRWITIDTSRVALALARSRIMGARYPYYLLADSVAGQQMEGQITHTAPKTTPTANNIRKGFVYERIPHITLKSIANNMEIDVIHDKYQKQLDLIRSQLNDSLGQKYKEWNIPRESNVSWNKHSKELFQQWWNLKKERQSEIDTSIATKAEIEYLYDKPYIDNKKIRVAGPFTVESLSPHRYIAVDENDNPICDEQQDEGETTNKFVNMILETLQISGVQQAHKADKINFVSVNPWPGVYICAEGRYEESETERRAAIFVGPEFGTVSRADLVSAVREAGDAGFDVLIACAFNFDAASSEFSKLGKIPVLKARMNADLHMAGELKNTGSGNLFVIFGEPDIEIVDCGNNKIQVKLRGVDIFHPNTGEVDSCEPDEIACWFIDTDYNEESFFVRHAYFLGANDPYSALKNSLKADIDKDAWESLHSDISRPFEKPESGRIAVKVINHLGDEVLKIFKVK